MLLGIDCCVWLVYAFLPPYLKWHADQYFKVSLQTRSDRYVRRSFYEIIRDPKQIINFILSMFFGGIVSIIALFAFISIFINSQLDPLDGYDLNLIIFEWTGHFPNTTLFM